MSSFRYSPLIHQDEIRVIKLLPAEHDDDLCCRMKHIRVSIGSEPVSSDSFQAPAWYNPTVNMVDNSSEPTTNATSPVLINSFKKASRRTKIVYGYQAASSALNTVWSHSFGQIELSEPTVVRL